jgi:hypothetical protein
MSAYLSNALQQPQLDYQILPSGASRTFASPTSPATGKIDEGSMPTNVAGVSITGDYLTATQEDYFLGLYWQSYHCTLQVFDESEFREHYKSLWISGTSRKPSALVDIVLALSMQYGIAFLPRSNAAGDCPADVDSNDATIAGRWFYRRCQTLISCELESPTIATVQCHILSVVYLCNASFQNMAHSSLAIAVRTAQMLGLHLEPPIEMPRQQREYRKRLWWTIYAMESKTSMKLGRPFATQMSQSTCNLPSDDHELALVSGSNFASPGENVTWLTYNLQVTKILLAARAVYTAFFDRCADVLGTTDAKSPYDDLSALESCAEFLSTIMTCIQSWLDALPESLKTRRRRGGQPYSVDNSPLDVELFAPKWLQRQRVLLELLYHNLSMNLTRPFVCFPPGEMAANAHAHAHAVACVSHGIAITNIMHQMLTETDILTGWLEAFQWQWNATLSMIGFILAYPIGPSTSCVRKTIDKAVVVFEVLGNNFAMAASAANVTRDLTAKADFLIEHVKAGSQPMFPGLAGVLAMQRQHGQRSGAAGEPDSINVAAADPGLSSHLALVEGESSLTMQNALADFLGLTFRADSFNSLDSLWGTGPSGSGMFDNWSFAQE